jgi:hypothetical protein
MKQQTVVLFMKEISMFLAGTNARISIMMWRRFSASVKQKEGGEADDEHYSRERTVGVLTLPSRHVSLPIMAGADVSGGFPIGPNDNRDSERDRNKERQRSSMSNTDETYTSVREPIEPEGISAKE